MRSHSTVTVLNQPRLNPLTSLCLVLVLCVAAQALVGNVIGLCWVAVPTDVNASNTGAELTAESSLTGEDNTEGLAIWLTLATLSGLTVIFTLPHLFHLSEALPPLLHPPQAYVYN